MGYVLELDLEFLDQLHELHKDYPLTSEKRLKLGMICCQVIIDQYCKHYK